MVEPKPPLAPLPDTDPADTCAESHPAEAQRSEEVRCTANAPGEHVKVFLKANVSVTGYRCTDLQQQALKLLGVKVFILLFGNIFMNELMSTNDYNEPRRANFGFCQSFK